MIKKIFIFLTFAIFTMASWGEETRFIMSSPNAVEMGQQFRLSFTLNERGNNLRLPPGLNNNFNVLMGPSTGQSTSIRSVNGKTTKEVTFSYTYILKAKNEGNFEIRPASIEVDGKVIESNSIKIQVVPAQSKASQQQSQKGTENNNQKIDLGADNLFLRVNLTKKNVFKGEQIIATVKLYADPNIPISGFEEVNLPTYEGFYTQDIEIPRQINFNREVYNDKIYQVGILKKTVLFPQQTGIITINPFSMTLLVQQRVRPRSFFDDFFGSIRTVRSTVTSKPLKVNVKKLPNQPSNYCGGVGKFNITSELSSENISTNDAVTLKIDIKGTGNLMLIRTPELKLPTDFEVYDPRSNDQIKTADNGVSGTKTIEYLFQPRFEGDYTIAPISITFFNPLTGSYYTRETPKYSLNVKKGSDTQTTTVLSSRQKEDIQLIGKDIRFIKQNNPLLRKKGTTFFGTSIFYLIYGISTFLFLILFFIYRKKAKENANIALRKNKKANRIATKRLKAAAIFMKKNQHEKFHEAILKAFWGYLSDKLSISLANLNKESAVNKLKAKNIENELIDNFVAIIEQCEFARYAPAEGSEERNELYKKAISTMSKLEKQIKK